MIAVYNLFESNVAFAKVITQLARCELEFWMLVVELSSEVSQTLANTVL